MKLYYSVGFSNNHFVTLCLNREFGRCFYFRVFGYGVSISKIGRPSFSERMRLRWYLDIFGFHIRLLRRGH